MGDLQPNFTGS